jgi:hypothetical protein
MAPSLNCRRIVSGFDCLHFMVVDAPGLRIRESFNGQGKWVHACGLRGVAAA